MLAAAAPPPPPTPEFSRFYKEEMDILQDVFAKENQFDQQMALKTRSVPQVSALSTFRCPVDSPMCSTDNLYMFHPVNVGVDLHSYGVLEQIRVFCSNGNFGQFFFICIDPK